MESFSVATMNLPLPAGEVAGDANSNQKDAVSAAAVEGVGSAVLSQDVLMSHPETNAFSQRDSLQEGAELSQSGKVFRYSEAGREGECRWLLWKSENQVLTVTLSY